MSEAQARRAHPDEVKRPPLLPLQTPALAMARCRMPARKAKAAGGDAARVAKLKVAVENWQSQSAQFLSPVKAAPWEPGLAR